MENLENLESSKKEKTRARVIFNPASGGGTHALDELQKELDEFEIDWFETEKAGDAQKAAREWDDGLLIVAGGDGTVNEVVNGLGKAGFPEGVTLGILPSGTGNDLAATLAIPEDPKEAERTLIRRRVRTLDAARATSEGVGEMFFINVATGGFGAETADFVDEEVKNRWGKLSYIRASLDVAQNFDVRKVKLILDGEERWIQAVNISVGNCRFVGGGWPAAPRANPEDGLLDLVVIEDLGFKETLALTPDALTKSDYLDHDGIFYAKARKIRVETSPGGLSFNADGELIGDEPVEFQILPKALKVIVGEDYSPEPPDTEE